MNVEEFFEIRVYQRDNTGNAMTERLVDVRRSYKFPTEEQIADAIRDNGGDSAEVVKRYELLPFA
jgi:hypothetical protein